jgi:predicted helicase
MYDKFLSVRGIFDKYNRGVVTSRDEFVISNNVREQRKKIEIFLDKSMPDDIVKASLKLKDGRSWKVEKIRKELLMKGISDELFVKYLYRPFDNKIIYYEDKLLERARRDIMMNLLRPNLALLLMRQVYWDKSYSHFLVTDSITDSRVFISNRGAADIFPLYLYKSKKQEPKIIEQKIQVTLGLEENTKEARSSNIKKEIINLLFDNYKKKFSPEEIFYYIYAVLYSNKYRHKYNEFLKIDFPRVPFTGDYKLFKKLSEIGEELAELHLLKSKKLDKLTAKFPKTGNNNVEKHEYNAKEKRIYINEGQYFENIDKELWEYYIGGYQVLDKWLKDRIGDRLSREDVDHYLKVIASLKYTINLQKKIDELYLQVEKDLIRIV